MAALAVAGLPLVIVNPAQLCHYALAAGKRAKTDPIDAAMIARFVEATRPEVFRQRLLDAGKPKMVNVIAVARKLLTILNAIVRDQKPWHTA